MVRRGRAGRWVEPVHVSGLQPAILWQAVMRTQDPVQRAVLARLADAVTGGDVAAGLGQLLGTDPAIVRRDIDTYLAALRRALQAGAMPSAGEPAATPGATSGSASGSAAEATYQAVQNLLARAGVGVAEAARVQVLSGPATGPIGVLVLVPPGPAGDAAAAALADVPGVLVVRVPTGAAPSLGTGTAPGDPTGASASPPGQSGQPAVPGPGQPAQPSPPGHVAQPSQPTQPGQPAPPVQPAQPGQPTGSAPAEQPGVPGRIWWVSQPTSTPPATPATATRAEPTAPAPATPAAPTGANVGGGAASAPKSSPEPSLSAPAPLLHLPQLSRLERAAVVTTPEVLMPAVEFASRVGHVERLVLVLGSAADDVAAGAAAAVTDPAGGSPPDLGFASALAAAANAGVGPPRERTSTRRRRPRRSRGELAVELLKTLFGVEVAGEDVDVDFAVDDLAAVATRLAAAASDRDDSDHNYAP